MTWGGDGEYDDETDVLTDDAADDNCCGAWWWFNDDATAAVADDHAAAAAAAAAAADIPFPFDNCDALEFAELFICEWVTPCAAAAVLIKPAIAAAAAAALTCCRLVSDWIVGDCNQTFAKLVASSSDVLPIVGVWLNACPLLNEWIDASVPNDDGAVAAGDADDRVTDGDEQSLLFESLFLW